MSRTIVLLILLGATAGCLSTAHTHASKSNNTVQLTATMPSRFDVVLHWQDPSATSAGHIVEFATEKDGEYVSLGFLPSSRTSLTHPRLIPDTTFYYRVRPYCGPASEAVEVCLPAGLSDAEFAKRYADAEDYSWGAPKTISGQVAAVRKSIRNPKTAIVATPTGLKAVVVPSTVSGILLTWTNHASDGEGYLIEMKADGAPDYQVCALVAPDVNSFGWSFAPPTRKGSFRVRAYYSGPPSNLISERTGPESEATYLISREKR